MIIDSTYPQAKPFGFRNSEINALLSAIPGAVSYSMYHMKPGPAAWFRHGYGINEAEFLRNKQEFIKYHPENAHKIKYLYPGVKYRANLAYSFFLAETYTMLPFLNENRIPFIFVLFPGGAFGINNASSDKMLSEIFSSDLFRSVIVTQQLTQEYLIEKQLCPEGKIVYDPAVSMQFRPEQVKNKKYYKNEKKSFDICFVAAKYSIKGVDKGYDVFIETARELAGMRTDIVFHVVGGFSAVDMDVSDIKDSIRFYGYLMPEQLLEFYSNMDIFLSPNRPFKLYEGNFDGFPLSAGAMYCGVCGFNTDFLKMNREYLEDEIVIINTQPRDIDGKNHILSFKLR